MISIAKSFLKFWLDIYVSRYQIWQLAKRDFLTEYITSYLGLFWALFRPAVFFITLYFVFTLGFRHAPNQDGTPFIAYLVSGMSAWFFFSSMLTSGAGVFRSYNFLIRRPDFKLQILPVMKTLSNLFLHFFFLIIVFIIILVSMPNLLITYIQLLYYIFAAMVLMIGLGWMMSSMAVFIPDVNQLIGSVIQIGFWATPIFWDINMFPPKLQIILKLNPAYYIVGGYRDSLLYNVWFWERPILTLYYWSFTFLVLFLGAIVYRKLRPHFAEVL